ncbi:carbamoyltransferase C-terminal domain-containing protein [Amycolatopsis sp. cmx-4-54]|uniref:carbamoyltransferase C-terminal domain-containing protein n=1 Tax=Amycolatopsis sp. cmx-4-54 TaxID=2790936 RepID=UPI00397B5547
MDVSDLYRDTPLPYHSVCHVFSAALLAGTPTSDRTILAFAVDGGPDFDLDVRRFDNWYAGAVFRGDTVEMFPIESPAPLYHVAAERYGMEEGTLMALAGASTANADATGLTDEVHRTVRFRGRPAYGDAEAILDELDGLVRKQLLATTPDTGPALSDELLVISAAMKHVQDMSEAVMRRNVDNALTEHRLRPRETELALAGGYALNCPTNSHLMNRYGFHRLLAPPCVNDSGQSLGIALATIAARTDRFQFRFPGAYAGDPDLQLGDALDEYADHIADVRQADPHQVVSDLAQGPIAWADGAAELGPRALGNRSLLAAPGNQAAKDRLNQVKGRQPWRPVAPVILAERVGEWFHDARESPYMLETFLGTAKTRQAAPAVLHLDGSARVQTVSADQNPRLHTVLTQVEAATGVPILCNTSLNDKGEPIVQNASQALNFCLRKGVSVAYVSGVRLELDGTDYGADMPARRPLADMAAPTEDSAALRARLNPHGLDELYLNLWLRVPELKTGFDPANAAHLPALKRAAEEWLRVYPCTLSWWGTGFAGRAAYLDKLDGQGFALGIGRPWTTTPSS